MVEQVGHRVVRTMGGDQFVARNTTRKPGSNERSELGNQTIAAYLKSLEVPQEVIELATQADPRDKALQMLPSTVRS
jgi:hypothetical protein